MNYLYHKTRDRFPETAVVLRWPSNLDYSIGLRHNPRGWIDEGIAVFWADIGFPTFRGWRGACIVTVDRQSRRLVRCQSRIGCFLIHRDRRVDREIGHLWYWY